MARTDTHSTMSLDPALRQTCRRARAFGPNLEAIAAPITFELMADILDFLTLDPVGAFAPIPRATA